MAKVILFGATGNVGREVAKVLVKNGHKTTLVVRNASKKEIFSDLEVNILVANPLQANTLAEICRDQDVVISAFGKSVSPNEWSKPTFQQVDLQGNINILNEAKNAGVKKFVYVSAFHAEKYPDLTYFDVHHQFSEILKKWGIDYSIIKPPAIFSAFLDMIEMAKKGRLINLGKGDNMTNPIFEGDLAEIIVDSISKSNIEIESGGQKVYSRKQLLEIIQATVDPADKIQNLPIKWVKLVLPFLRIVSRNSYDKIAFFIRVMETDTIAPAIGSKTFEEYVLQKMAIN